jgi:hypothetical protein
VKSPLLRMAVASGAEDAIPALLSAWALCVGLSDEAFVGDRAGQHQTACPHALAGFWALLPAQGLPPKRF